MAEEQEQENLSSKQIPVISDIERIKKIIEIIEFVGEKVGDVIEKLPTPQSVIQTPPNDKSVDLMTTKNETILETQDDVTKNVSESKSTL